MTIPDPTTLTTTTTAAVTPTQEDLGHLRWVPTWRASRPWRVTVREYEYCDTDDDGAFRPHVVRTGVNFSVNVMGWAWIRLLSHLSRRDPRHADPWARIGRVSAWARRRIGRVQVLYHVPEGARLPTYVLASAGEASDGVDANTN